MFQNNANLFEEFSHFLREKGGWGSASRSPGKGRNVYIYYKVEINMRLYGSLNATQFVPGV